MGDGGNMASCANGHSNEVDQKFCGTCGTATTQNEIPTTTPVSYAPPSRFAPPASDAKPRNGNGVAGFSLGVVSVLASIVPAGPLFSYLAAICSIFAIIFSSLGIKRANRGLATNKSLAVIGLILGIAVWPLSFLLSVA